MSPEELQESLSEVDRLEKAGFFLKAVAALKKLCLAHLSPDDVHRVHLRLAETYRRQGLDDEANREILAVAAHWTDEGRLAEARNLLASVESLLPGGLAMLGEMPADGEAAREALDGLIASLRKKKPMFEISDEVTPVDDLLPGLKGGGSKLPALPAPSSGSRGPRVPLPAAQVDTSKTTSSRSAIDEHIDRIGALVQKDPADVKSRVKLADLLLKAGRTSDGIAHLVLAAVHFEKAGEPHHAVKLYKKVLEVAPERRELHNRLGDIYTHLGLLAEAATEYDKAKQKQT